MEEFNKIYEQLKQKEAVAFTEELDKLQNQGANPKQLAELYKQLDPELKEYVKQYKQQKLEKQKYEDISKKRLMNKLPGTSTQRISSPITKQAYQILQETNTLINR